jgi:hypothetical protein
MRSTLLNFAIIILTATLYSCSSTPKKEVLFNGKDLSNWSMFLQDPQINHDSVFSVKDGIIQIAGMPFGFIRTLEDYRNYKLHVEYRWPGEPSNSGIFLHVNGENRVWPSCYECQLRNNSAGDIILMRTGTNITIKDSTFFAPEGERPYKACPKFSESSEKPAGEWNSIDIICENNTIEIRVNGVLQNKGTNLTMTSGAICLQSEGGPIQFRNVYLEYLK